MRPWGWRWKWRDVGRRARCVLRSAHARQGSQLAGVVPLQRFLPRLLALSRSLVYLTLPLPRHPSSSLTLPLPSRFPFPHPHHALTFASPFLPLAHPPPTAPANAFAQVGEPKIRALHTDLLLPRRHERPLPHELKRVPGRGIVMTRRGVQGWECEALGRGCEAGRRGCEPQRHETGVRGTRRGVRRRGRGPEAQRWRQAEVRKRRWCRGGGMM
ncbi:hypothetical protein B0H12DRAFT_747327 [Mycena haematopus]|nr:hypothetical protein B0H12DRAFT_747327 [Mycena haematopus]